jgi:hypothetical protein
MRLRDRYARFSGLMAVLSLFLCVSVVSCCKCPSPTTNNPTLGVGGYATVSGAVRDDLDGDGYEVSEPGIPGPSMRLYNASYNYGPIDRSPGGGYSFTVTPGTYTLEASAVDYITKSRTITLNNTDNKTSNFGLRHE